MKNSSLIYGAIAATSVICWCTSAFCEGRIVIEPKITTIVQNDSNFWKAENDEVSVNTFLVKPGVLLGYNTAKTKIEADVALEAFYYDDNDTPPLGVRDADDDNYVGFAGMFKLTNQTTDRLNLGLLDSLYVTRDPASADELSDSVLREKYTVNRITPSSYYAFGDKFGFGAKYRNSITDYSESGEDSTENRGIFDLYYNLNRSTSVFLDYQIWAWDYDLSSVDYTSNELSLNFAKKFGFVTLSAGGGYHNRAFDGDVYDDIDGFIWKLSVQGQSKTEEGQKPRVRGGLFLTSNLNDSGAGDEYYTATKLALNCGYRITNRIETGLNLSFQNSDYEEDPQNRDDDTTEFSGKIGYDILKNFVVAIEGGVQDRSSNISGESYDNVFVMASLYYSFDVGGKE